MCNKGTISTAISLDIVLYNEMEKLRTINNTSRSRFIQTGIRLNIARTKKMELQDIADSLDTHEKKELIKLLNL